MGCSGEGTDIISDPARGLSTRLTTGESPSSLSETFRSSMSPSPLISLQTLFDDGAAAAAAAAAAAGGVCTKSNLGCKSSSDLRGVAAMAVNGDMATDFISLRMSLTSGLSLLLNCAVAIDDKLFWKLNLEEEEDEDEEEEEE